MANITQATQDKNKYKMKLLIKFPDESRSFAYGVEYGRLLERIEQGQEVIKNNGFPIRNENVELLCNTCKIYGYIPTFSGTEVEGWTNFLGIKKTNSNN